MARSETSTRIMVLSAAVVALVSCAAGKDETRNAAQPSAPPSLGMAGEAGLKTDVYFSRDLQSAMTRLDTMKSSLDQLQGDLQSTTLAMKRVDDMQKDLAELDTRFKLLQARMSGAPDVGAVPGPMGMSAMAGVPASGTTITTTPTGHSVTQTTVTTIAEDIPADTRVSAIAAPVVTPGPTPLTANMGSSSGETLPAVSAPAKSVTTTTTTTASTKAAPMLPIVENKPKAAAKPKAEEPKAEKPAAAPAGGKGVQGVRLGTHGDQVRIVLDVNGATTFTSDLDTTEKLLTVELPNTAWSGAASKAFSGNPLVASYSAQPSGNGSVVVFALKGGSRIASTSALKATGGKPARIVIDLAR